MLPCNSAECEFVYISLPASTERLVFNLHWSSVLIVVVIVTGGPEPEPDVIETSFKSETEVTRVVKKQTVVTR